MNDIIKEMGEASLIIADITPANPNVCFEVGYALALSKPTILLARKDTALPFDVAELRVLFCEDTNRREGTLGIGMEAPPGRNLDHLTRRTFAELPR